MTAGNGEAPGSSTTPGPATTTATVVDHEPTGAVRQDRALRWLVGELETVAEIIHAAQLSAKAGHRPAVHVRRAAVRLAALDAGLGGELAPIDELVPDP